MAAERTYVWVLGAAGVAGAIVLLYWLGLRFLKSFWADYERFTDGEIIPTKRTAGLTRRASASSQE